MIYLIALTVGFAALAAIGSLFVLAMADELRKLVKQSLLDAIEVKSKALKVEREL